MQIKGILISKRHWSVYFYLFSHRMTRIDDKKKTKKKKQKQKIELPDDVIIQRIKLTKLTKILLKQEK